jgi:hypothetical protein
VVVQVSDPDGTLYGTRELDSPDPDCRTLDEIVALVIAVTLRRERTSAGGIALPEAVAAELDRLFASDSPELDPATLPPSAAGTTAPPAVPPPPATGPAPDTGPSPLSLELDAGVAGVSGLQAGVTLAPRLRARLVARGLGSAGLEGALGLASEDEVDGREVGTLHFWTWYAGAVVCGPAWLGPRFELSVCAAARLGRLRVRARGFRFENTRQTEFWFELGPEVDGLIYFDPLFLQLSLGVPIRIRAPEFAYRSSAGVRGQAFAMDRAGVHAGVGVGLRF